MINLADAVKMLGDPKALHGLQRLRVIVEQIERGKLDIHVRRGGVALIVVIRKRGEDGEEIFTRSGTDLLDTLRGALSEAGLLDE